MRTMRRLVLAIAAMCLSLGLAGTSARAAGPMWLANGERFNCERLEAGVHTYKTVLECLGGHEEAGERRWLRNTHSESGVLEEDQGLVALALNAGSFTLKGGSAIAIVCHHMHAALTLDGGEPGKGHGQLDFVECEVEGHPSCTVKSTGSTGGSIAMTAKLELIYLGTKKQAEKERGPEGVLFSPESGAKFVTLELSGSGCPVFTEGEREVKGSFIGEVANVGTMAKDDNLIFPAGPIETGWRWLKKEKGKVEEVEAVLKAFGVVKAALSGEAKAMLGSEEEWGVTGSPISHEGGPLWLVNGERYACKEEAGEYGSSLECLGGPGVGGASWKRVILAGTVGGLQPDQGATALALNLGSFRLKAGTRITIWCAHVHSQLAFEGGMPGRGHAQLDFKECEVEGKPSCLINSAGEPHGSITMSAELELVYTGTKAEAEKEEGSMGVLFTPESGEPFTRIVLSGEKCPSFNESEREVKGSVIANVASVNSMTREDHLEFFTTPIKTGWLWEDKGEVEEINAKLMAFGVTECALAGEADAMLKDEEEWGVTRT
jgi:hypothetical protein